MSLLAFLTGLAGGADKAISGDRERVAAEQQDELNYRRTNLEHMVKAAEEGRVNPALVGRVYQEYLDSMQGLSSRPGAKGMGASFRGKKDLSSNNSVLRDLVTGVTSLFGPGTNASQPESPQTAPSAPGELPQALLQIPDLNKPDSPGLFDPTNVERDPLARIVNQSAARLNVTPTSPWLIQNPDYVKAQQAHEDLLKKIGDERAKSEITIEEQQRLGGSLTPNANRWSRNPIAQRELQPVKLKDGTIVRPILKQYNTGESEVLDPRTMQPFTEPTESAMTSQIVFNDRGEGSVYDPYRRQVSPVATLTGAVAGPGVGRTTQPHVPPPQRLELTESDLRTGARKLVDDYDAALKSATSLLRPGTEAYAKAEEQTWARFASSAKAGYGVDSAEGLRIYANRAVPLAGNTSGKSDLPPDKPYMPSEGEIEQEAIAYGKAKGKDATSATLMLQQNPTFRSQLIKTIQDRKQKK